MSSQCKLINHNINAMKLKPDVGTPQRQRPPPSNWQDPMDPGAKPPQDTNCV